MTKKCNLVLLSIHATLISVQILFSGNIIFTKLGVNQIQPVLFTLIRISMAVPALFIFAYISTYLDFRKAHLENKNLNHNEFMKKHFFPESFREIGIYSLMGMLGICATQLSFAFALRFTTANSVSLLQPTIPVFTHLFAIIIKIERTSWIKGSGILLSVIGAGLMVGGDKVSFNAWNIVGDLACLLNTSTYAGFLVCQKIMFSKFNKSPLVLTAWCTLFALLLIAIISLGFIDQFSAVQKFSPLNWLSIAYAGIVNSCIAYTLNGWANKMAGASQTAIYITVLPLAGSILAAIFLGETIFSTVGSIFGAILIIAGLLLVVLTKVKLDEIKIETKSSMSNQELNIVIPKISTIDENDDIHLLEENPEINSNTTTVP